MSSLAGNMMRSLDFGRKLQALYDARQSAHKVKATDCQKCGFCCWRAPGGLHPQDVLPLARRKGLTPVELFEQYLTVHDMGRYDDLYTVIPIRHRQSFEAGGYLSASGSFDINRPCVFLDEGTSLCSLHGTDAQPTECRHGVTCISEVQSDGRVWTPAMLLETFNFDIEAAKGCDDWND